MSDRNLDHRDVSDPDVSDPGVSDRDVRDRDVRDRTDVTVERVRFLTRWRWLSRGARTVLVLVVAPLFYLLPLLLRRSGVDEGVALVVGVAAAAVIAVVVGLVATRFASTPRPPTT